MSRVPHLEDRPRRLLVVTFHFPPDGSVGGLRWGGMSKYLARRGWVVDIVTASPQKGPPSEPGVNVHYVPRATTLNDRYNELMGRLREQSTPAAASGPAPVAAAPAALPAEAFAPRRGALAWLRKKVSQALIYPDDGRGWVLRAARAAHALIQEHEYAAVVTSGPPHSAHIAGALACVGRPGLFWADMRDPWGTTIEKKKAKAQFDSIALRVPYPWLERAVFRHVHHIVANTAAAADHLRKHYPNKLVSFVPNGIDPERLPPRATEKFAGRAISYVGTLYLGRDLTEMVHAMKAFVDRHPEARGKLTLHVAGSMDAPNEAAFWREVNNAGLADMVKVYGRVPGATALELINKSHLTLVLAQDQELQVPAKLYECVAMGVPTLAVAEPGSAAEREARRIGALTCEPQDVAGMTAILERVWNDDISTTPPIAAISYETISKQMEALLRPAAARQPLFESEAAHAR
jgi:glycosyltransferase involved in cell wall biosynthesis